MIDELRCWFTPLYRSKMVDYDPQLKQSLYRLIEDLVSKSNGTIKSNIGGWQSESIRIGEYPELDRYVGTLQPLIDQLSQMLETPMEVTNFWININNKGHYNEFHNHSKSLMSGVVYLDAGDDQGNLIFKSCNEDNLLYGLYSNGFEKYVSKFLGRLEVQPSTDDIIIFPSFLSHCVEPNGTDMSRVSLAFNLGLKSD